MLIFSEKKINQGYFNIEDFPCISEQPCLKSMNEEIFKVILGFDYNLKLKKAKLINEKKENYLLNYKNEDSI